MPSPDRPSTVADPRRLKALRETGLLDSAVDPLFDRLTALTARLLEVPTALVSLVDFDRQFFKGAFGLAEPWASRREAPLSHSFCRNLVAGERLFEVTDARVDPRVREDLAVPELGVVAYLGVPLHSQDGERLGALCAIDGQPRQWSAEQLVSLRELAAVVEGAIAERTLRRALESRTQVYEVLLERIPNTSIVLFDHELTYLLVRGQRLYDQLGVSPKSLEGLNAEDATSPANRARLLPLYRDALEGNESRLTVHFKERTYDVQIVPARDARGSIVGGIVMSHDVTDLATSERALHQRTLWLESVLEAMDDAVVVMDGEGKIVLTNEVGRQLFGDWPNAQAWPTGSGFFMADERTPVPIDLLPANQALKGVRVHQQDLFIRPPSAPQSALWLSINATPLRDGPDQVSGAVIVSRDTTILREASLEIIENNRDRGLLHQVAAAANQFADVDRVLREALTAILERTGWPLGHVYFRSGERTIPSSIWVGPQRESFGPLVAATMAIPPEHKQRILDDVLQSARMRFVENLAAEADPLRAPTFLSSGFTAGVFLPIKIDDQAVAVVELFLPPDVPRPDSDFLLVLDDAISTLGRVFERAQTRAALQRHSDQLQALSLIDDLTGLYNRRGFLTLAEQQRRAGQRARLFHHLIYVDLDGMKGINDQLGHAQGDVALQDTAKLLRSVFRESDILARLGGDEFVVFAASGTADGDRPIVGRVREALRVYNQSGTRPFKIEMSIGATPCDPERPRPIDELLRAADALMYEQKRQRKAKALEQPR